MVNNRLPTISFAWIIGVIGLLITYQLFIEGRGEIAFAIVLPLSIIVIVFGTWYALSESKHTIEEKNDD